MPAKANVTEEESRDSLPDDSEVGKGDIEAANGRGGMQAEQEDWDASPGDNTQQHPNSKQQDLSANSFVWTKGLEPKSSSTPNSQVKSRVSFSNTSDGRNQMQNVSEITKLIADQLKQTFFDNN